MTFFKTIITLFSMVLVSLSSFCLASDISDEALARKLHIELNHRHLKSYPVPNEKIKKKRTAQKYFESLKFVSKNFETDLGTLTYAGRVISTAKNQIIVKWVDKTITTIKNAKRELRERILTPLSPREYKTASLAFKNRIEVVEISVIFIGEPNGKYPSHIEAVPASLVLKEEDSDGEI